MASIKIDVINKSTVLTDTQIQSAVPALQTQVHRDFAASWGIDPDLNFVPKSSNPNSNSWLLGIFDNSDQAGALGYHDLTSQGLPLAKVFAESDMQAGLSWTVTASHELLEMIGDPNIDLTVFVQNTNTTGTYMRTKSVMPSRAILSGTRSETCWYLTLSSLRGSSPLESPAAHSLITEIMFRNHSKYFREDT